MHEESDDACVGLNYCSLSVFFCFTAYFPALNIKRTKIFWIISNINGAFQVLNIKEEQ